MFLNIDSRTGHMIHIKTWTNVVPLWGGIAKEFWSPNGIRTLAPSEPLYNPRSGYWRGPVWIVSNYLVMQGLAKCGYKQEAVRLAEETVNLLVRDLRATGGMNEDYNPETREPAAAGHFRELGLACRAHARRSEDWRGSDCDQMKDDNGWKSGRQGLTESKASKADSSSRGSSE